MILKMLSLQCIQENALSAIKKERCCNGRNPLSAQFIEQQKLEQVVESCRRARINRRKIWQHKYRELSNLCAEVFRSYATYRHYLSYAPNELIDLGPDTGTFVRDWSPSNNLLIRSKAFFDATATSWGRNEAEYYQIQDTNGNMARRPFWIRIDSTADICYVLRKMGYINSDYVRRLEDSGSVERADHEVRYANRHPLRTGPIQRSEVNILNVNQSPNFWVDPTPTRRPRLLFGSPMYHALDHSKYNVKSTSKVSKTLESLMLDVQEVLKVLKDPKIKQVESVEVEVEVTDYKEHSLLTKNPKIVYTKMEWSYKDKKYVDLYDEDGTLMERTVKWSSSDTNLSLDEEWYVFSFDVITMIHSKVVDGYNSFISMFVTKKGEYEVEINDKNQATVKVEEEKKLTVDGLTGYKAAVTEDGRRCLIEMIVPKNARVASSVHAAGKFRADKVVPMKIYLVDIGSSSSVASASSSTTIDLSIDMILMSSDLTVAIPCVYSKGIAIKYTVGEELKVDNNNFYHHMDEVCRPGIHYCMTKREALDFHLKGGQTLNKIIDA